MPYIPIEQFRPGDDVPPLKCLCEVRVRKRLVAEFGPFESVFQATLAMAQSPLLTQLPRATYAAVRAEDRELICKLDARGLLALRELERERHSLH